MTNGYKDNRVNDTLSLRGVKPGGENEHLMLPGLYLLWVVMAWINVRAGELGFIFPAGALLLGGIAATNCFFVMLTRPGANSPYDKATLYGAACWAALFWTAAFQFVSAGVPELVLCMNITVLIFSLYRLSESAFRWLAAGMCALFLSVTAARSYVAPVDASTLTETLRFVMLVGVTLWCISFTRYLHAMRDGLFSKNDELQTQLEDATRSADHDHLTKSFSRRYILDALEREKARADRGGKTFAVCIFDLDHFKRVNDDYGHLVGDKILSGFAKRVKGELRVMDTVNRTQFTRSLGRYGGEEFIVVLPNTGIHGAFRCAERIRKATGDRPFEEKYRVTTSVGVAVFKRGESIAQLLGRADTALYEAKEEGRDRVCCSGGLPQDLGTQPVIRAVR